MKMLKYQKQLFKALSKECRLIIFTIFLIVFSTYLFTPYIPVYLHEQGLSPSQIGFVVFLQFLLLQSGSASSGFLSDKHGPYILLKISVFLRMLIVIGILLFKANLLIMIVFLMLFSVTGAVIGLTQRSLLLSKIASPREKSYAISLNNSAINLGQSLGIAIGGIIFMIDYLISILLVVFIYFITISIVVFLITKSNVNNTKSINVAAQTSNRDRLLQNKFFLLVICSQFFYISIWQNILTYFSLFINDVYSSIISYSLIMSLSFALISMSQMFLGTLLSTYRFRDIVCIGYGIVICGFTGIFLWHGSIVVVAIFMFLVAFGFSIITLQNELQIINSKNIGAVYGAFRFFTGLGVLTVYMNGYVYEWLVNIGKNYFFWFYLSLFAVCILLTVFFVYPYVKNDEKTFKEQKT